MEKRKGKIKVNEIKENRTAVYVLRRYLLLCAGLAIMAFGVAFSIKASLGTSPISSVPYVVSLFAPLTVLFGYLTDFGVWAVRGIRCDTYWQQWIVCLIGILLVAAASAWK